jgi:hypothetical protein
MTCADPGGPQPPGDRRAIAADPRLDPGATVWAPTDAGFGNLAAPITSGTAARVSQSWCQIHLTITTVVHTDSLPRIIMGPGNAPPRSQHRGDRPPSRTRRHPDNRDRLPPRTASRHHHRRRDHGRALQRNLTPHQSRSRRRPCTRQPPISGYLTRTRYPGRQASASSQSAGHHATRSIHQPPPVQICITTMRSVVTTQARCSDDADHPVMACALGWLASGQQSDYPGG